MKSRSSAAIQTLAIIGLLASASVFAASPNRMIEPDQLPGAQQDRNRVQKPPQNAPTAPVAPPARAVQREQHSGQNGGGHARHHNDHDTPVYRPGPARPPVYVPPVYVPPPQNHGRWGNAHWHDGHRYHFQGNRWYRFNDGRYWAIVPPLGLWIGSLPPNYRSQWVGQNQYFYADGIYYANHHNGNGYVVVAQPTMPAPVVQPIIQPPPPPSYPGYTDFIQSIFVYPRGSQTEARTAADKQECAQWAGTQVLGNAWAAPVQEPQTSDYRRAMGACLEARNYVVR